MGLATELSYSIPRANRFHKVMQVIAASRPGGWFFSKTLARADRRLERWSQGRVTIPSALARLPVLLLTTTGRRTGRPRQTHLTAIPFGDSLAVLGTNFGQPSTPSWVLNLEAQPRASVTHRGISRSVVARPATQDEQTQILLAAADVYPGYRTYQRRIIGRRLRVFVLDPE